MTEGPSGNSSVAISAIVPTFNRLPKLKRAIGSLLAQECPSGPFEIVVVDDGSTDGTREWLAAVSQQKPNLRFTSQKHSGPAVARNLGVKMARGEVFLFVGDDIITGAGLLERHLFMLKRNGMNVAIQGRVRLAPEVERTRFVRYLDERSWAQFRPNTADAGDELDFALLYTCNCSVPKRLLVDCGGFPEDVIYYDDTFLGWQLQQKKVRILYEPKALCYHDHTQTLEEFLQRQKQVGKDAAALVARFPELRSSLRMDQIRLLEGPAREVVKKVVKRLLCNKGSVPLLKRLAGNRLVPFPVACIIYSLLIGYEHRIAAATAAFKSRSKR